MPVFRFCVPVFRFFLEIPLDPLFMTLEASAPGLADRRILLAEDNIDARNAFVPRLVHLGLRVTTARDGREACVLALAAVTQGEPFDWILMDMQMPIVDGFEATHRLRGQGYDRPIIALTAHAFDLELDECLRSGCDAHVTKPIDWDHLAAVLKAHLRSM